MSHFIQEIKENKLAFLLNLLIRLSIFYFLAEVMLFQDDPRFAGKAIPIRNLIIVLTFSSLLPVLYFLKKLKKYPVWLDNLYLSIFWFDMAGNSLDLYDSYFYFDIFPHFHGTGAFASFLFGAFNFGVLKAILVANLIHGLLEGQEIFTDVFFGTHNVRGAFDSINDMIVGFLGTVIYVKLTSHFLKNKASKLKIVVLVVIIISLLTMFFHRNIALHTKTFFFITQSLLVKTEIKPLALITEKPIHSKIETGDKKEIVADLFVPNEKYTPKSKRKKPAVIVAMGVKTAKKDEPLILDFSSTLSRLGYVVLWPRDKDLDRGISLPENPDTFVKSFEYLEKLDFVDDRRISFVGFSVGSSIALVAAEDPAISDKVNSFIFFGGYYDIFDYLESLESKSMVLDGKRISWQPSEGAINHTEEILETLNLGNLETVLKTKPKEFRKLSPSENIDKLKVKIFILHEKSDSYVPYVESIKLNNALSLKLEKKFVLVNLFDHVQPKGVFSKEIFGEFFKLYGFTTQVLLKL